MDNISFMTSRRLSHSVLAAATAAALGLVAWPVQARSAQATLMPASAHWTYSAAKATPGSLATPDPLGPELRFRMRSPRVCELQVRLRHARYLAIHDVDDRFGMLTREAVPRLQRDSGLRTTGVVDQPTWDALLARSRRPTEAELNSVDVGPWFTARTQDGYMKELQHRLRQVGLYQGAVDGKVHFTREARFAMPGWESPEGEFRIWYMNSDTVSKIFGERTPMPYAIFYQGNVAIHFSQDFADKGYESGSHGCSQLRDYRVAKWLYEQVKVGDRVVVY